MRDHLMSEWRQSGVRPIALAPVPCPEMLQHVWGWWLQLHRARQRGIDGPAPIGWTDIDAWTRLTRISITPFEIRALQAVDDLFLNQKRKSND